jgi:hypothetical protein
MPAHQNVRNLVLLKKRDQERTRYIQDICSLLSREHLAHWHERYRIAAPDVPQQLS